jgi:uncharacterized protein YerC
MTKVSKSGIKSDVLEWFVDRLWDGISTAKNDKKLKAFLKELLTPTERIMIAKRLQIAKMLIAGHRYETIKKVVKVTDPTIAKISNIISDSKEGLYAVALNQTKREDVIRKENTVSQMERRYPSYYLLDRIIRSISKKLRK